MPDIAYDEDLDLSPEMICALLRRRSRNAAMTVSEDRSSDTTRPTERAFMF